MIDFYLPITSQPRELDAKLLLALTAAERGHCAWIGYKSAFQKRLDTLNRGIFLAHNARQSIQRMKLVHDFGHRVFVLDEEALVRQTDEIFIKKHPPKAFDNVDKILCWGQDDFDMWQRFGISGALPTEIAGNLRFDLLRPELSALYDDDVRVLRERFGEYVLLNTNFPTINNVTPFGGGVRLNRSAMDEHGKAISEKFLTFKRTVFDAELALIKPLCAAIYPRMLVIRPHPNEDHTPWHEAAKAVPNAAVVFEGGIVPWLFGAKVLIHNNCTTSVEAATAGTPVVNFLPVETEFNNPLSNSFGYNCRTISDVIAAVQAICDERVEALSEAQRNTLRHHIRSVDGPMSAELIVSITEAVFASVTDTSPNPQAALKKVLRHGERLRFKRYLGLYLTPSGWKKRRHLENTYPNLDISQLDFEQLGFSIEQLDLMMRQFPPFEHRSVDERIAKFAKATGRFEAIKADILSQQMVRLRKI